MLVQWIFMSSLGKQPLLSLHGHIHEAPDTEKGRGSTDILKVSQFVGL